MRCVVVPAGGGLGEGRRGFGWLREVVGEPRGKLVAEGVGEWLTVGREFLEEALVGNNGVYGLRGFVSCSNGTERSWRSLMRGEELVCARAGSGETLEGERRRGAVRAAAGDDEYQDRVAMGRVGAG